MACLCVHANQELVDPFNVNQQTNQNNHRLPSERKARNNSQGSSIDSLNADNQVVKEDKSIFESIRE